MKDYRDRWFVKKLKVKDVVNYLERNDIKEQYKNTLDSFGVVEQEIYPVEEVSERKLGSQFKGLIKFWKRNGADLDVNYEDVQGRKGDYLLRVKIYYV